MRITIKLIKKKNNLRESFHNLLENIINYN